MNYLIICYIAYLLLTVSLTVWVARTLFRNGRVFLIEIFHGNTPFADAVNKLLLTGFYLINIGYAVYTLKIFSDVNSETQVIETLSVKVGAIILILGGMHFMNLFVLFNLRKKSKRNFTPSAE